MSSCVATDSYLDEVERALAAGEVVLIENIEETLDPVLGPLLGRETIKKGRYGRVVRDTLALVGAGRSLGFCPFCFCRTVSFEAKEK